MFEKIDFKFSVFPSICFILFSFLMKTSGLSLLGIINLNNDLFKKSIIETAGMNTYQTLIFILSSYSYIFLALLFFVLGLAFIAGYGTQNNDYINSLLPSFIGTIFTIFFLGFSIITVFISIAMIISSLLVLKYASLYFEEIQKWKYFRTGGKAIGNSLIAFNLIVALGALIAVNSAQDFYKTGFVTDIKNTLTEIALKEVQDESEDVKNTIRTRIEGTVENSEMIQGYLRFLPIVVAIEIWFLLEITRLFISNIGGLFTYFILKHELG